MWQKWVSDMLQGKGLETDFPAFLIASLRKIVYKLKQAGMWAEYYDIRLTVSKKYRREFLADDLTFIIQGVIISIEENDAYPECYYLAVYSIGQNQLIYKDGERWVMTAPWAIARFEVIE